MTKHLRECFFPQSNILKTQRELNLKIHAFLQPNERVLLFLVHLPGLHLVIFIVLPVRISEVH